MTDDELLDELEDNGAEVDDVLDRLCGADDLYIEYLVKFPENENIVKLRKAVEEKDPKTALSEAHTLKGVALNLGLLPLVDACMFMIMDYRADKPEKADEGLPMVEERFKMFADIIAKYQK